MCLTKNLYPEYLKNSQNSIVRKPIISSNGKIFKQIAHPKRCVNGKEAQEKMHVISHQGNTD